MSDEDIKIYRGVRLEPSADPQDPAAQFLHHRDCGHLEKAAELGERLARRLAEDTAGLSDDPHIGQKLVLISFMANRAMTEGIPDLILQKSTQSVFQQSLERMDPKLARRLTDSTAYTLYLLCANQNYPYGPVLANLCHESGNQALAEAGNELAGKYEEIFNRIVSDCKFS